MEYLLLTFSFVLLILAITLHRDWSRDTETELTYSILIACRNEARNLPFLFNALNDLDYPSEKFEIIIVDDASSDDSLQLLENFAEQRTNIKILSLTTKNTKYKGKKAALKAAAETAQFEILLFTDADCLPPADWLSSYNHLFKEDTSLVIGYSPERTDNSFIRFTQIFNAGLYAATTGLGIPFSCSGRNFAIRKAVFQDIGGYESFKENLAGDDKQLLNLVVRKKYRVAYNNSAPVTTMEAATQMDQQKRRYAKFTQHRTGYQIAALVIFLFYLLLPWWIVQNPVYFVFYFSALLLFWFSNLLLHKEKLYFIDLLFLLVLPYYMIVLSLWGMSSGWRWKGNQK